MNAKGLRSILVEYPIQGQAFRHEANNKKGEVSLRNLPPFGFTIQSLHIRLLSLGSVAKYPNRRNA